MAYEWVSAGESPASKITFYVTRGLVAFDIAITVDGGDREDTAAAMGDIRDALISDGFDVQTINTGTFGNFTLEETA